MSNHRILFVIAPENFRDEEFFVPYKHFQSLGWTCTVTSPKTGLASGMLGGSFPVEQVLDDSLNANDYDALVISGGGGSPQWLWNDKTLRTLVQAFSSSEKPTAAICLSGVVLSNSGVLAGKNATVWPMDESIQAYQDAGVNYLTNDVVIDGHFITANGPEAAKAFTQAIEKALTSSTASVS